MDTTHGHSSSHEEPRPGVSIGRADKDKSQSWALRTQSTPAEAISEADTYNPLQFFDRAQSCRPLPMFERRNSAEAAEASMALIMRLKEGLAEMDRRAGLTLQNSQNVIDACGDAIAAWFKGLSGMFML